MDKKKSDVKRETEGVEDSKRVREDVENKEVSGENSKVQENKLVNGRNWSDVNMAQAHQCVKLQKFDPSEETFANWLARFEAYGELSKWTAQDKLKLLPLYLDSVLFRFCNNLPDQQKDSYEHLVQALGEILIKTDNVEALQQKFYSIQQQDNEQFFELQLRVTETARVAFPDQTVDARKKLAKSAFLRALKDDDVKLHLMMKELDNVEEMRHEADKYLQMKLCLRSSNVKQSRYVTGVAEDQSENQKLRDEVKHLKSEMAKLSTDKRKSKFVKCYNCGRLGHIAKSCWQDRKTNVSFPAKKPVTCYNCGGENHFRRHCKASPKKRERTEGSGRPNQLSSQRSNKTMRPYVHVWIGGQKFIALIDSGASCSVLNARMLPKLNLTENDLQPKAYSSITSVSGEGLDVQGQMTLKWKWASSPKYSCTSTFHVIGGVNEEVILGYDIIKNCKLIFDWERQTVKHDRVNIPLLQPDQLGVVGNLVCVAKTETIAPHSIRIIQGEVIGDLRSKWQGYHAVVTPTQPGCLISDAIVTVDRSFVPLAVTNSTDEEIQILAGAEVATTEPVDLEEELHPQDIDDCCFPGPMLDDLDHLTSTQKQRLIEEVFRRFKEARIKFNAKKCQLVRFEVSYLGHLISAEGVSPNYENVRKVEEFPTPKTARQVKSFLGLGAYYRRFIKDFAKITKPLYDLTRKDVKFVWAEEHQKAFVY